MKTLNELYKEVLGSEELKKEYIAAAKDGKVTGFIKDHGVDATEAEIRGLLSFFFTAHEEAAAIPVSPG